MSSLILRTIAPVLVLTMLVFSVFVLLRGHDLPGGGFIGGLIAASAVAIYGVATSARAARHALRVHPIVIAGLGLFVAAFSGLLSLNARTSFLTGLWTTFRIGETEINLSTPQLFDLGVYLVVFGTMAAIALALEGDEPG